MLFAFLPAAAFFVIGLPLVGVLGAFTAIFLGHHYHTIVMSTASGSGRVTWPSEGLADMLWKAPYVVWLVGCSTGPAMILGGVLAKYMGVAGFLVPALCLWLLFPVVQLSSLYASSIWVPFTPVTLRKMAGKPTAVFGFYLQSFGVVLFATVGFWMTFLPHRLGWGGTIGGGLILALCVFVYARLLGRLAFVCSFVGAEERPAEERLPLFTAEAPVERPKKKKKIAKAFVRTKERTRLAAPDSDDGVGYDLRIADEPAPAAPEKEFVPPQFAWDDEPATAYDAKPPDVEVKAFVNERVFEVKESEMKLISRDDAPTEPKRAWTADVWMSFFGDPNTIANCGLAVVWLVVDGLFGVVMRSFL